MKNISKKYFFKFTIFIAIYIAGTLPILSLQGSSAPPLAWVPGGFALAFILIEGTMFWPAIFIGGVGAIWFLGRPTAVGIAVAFANTITALVAHRLLSSRQLFDTRFSRIRDVITFISSAVILSSLIGACIGVLILYFGFGLARERVIPVTLMWTAGAALGIQIITPLILSAYHFQWRDPHRNCRLAECLLITGSVLLMSLLLFSAPTKGTATIIPTLPYIVFPLIVWGALRMGMLGTAVMNTIVSACTIWGTTHGLGPFGHGSLPENIYIAQGFIFILSTTGLIISSSAAERNRAITERAEALSEGEKFKVYTEAMRQSEAFLSSVIDNLPNIVFVKDAKDLRFVRLNKALEDLSGFSREELIGKNDYDFFPTEQADHFTSNDRAVLNLGILVDIPQETISTKYRGDRLLHTRKIPIFDPKTGDPVFLLGISEDITESKKAEAYRSKLLTDAKAAELASQTKSLFLANMSHEIRTPLGAIIGFTNLLKDPNLTPVEKDSYFEVISRNGKALSQLIEDILDLSKVEANRLVVETIETNLNELISDVRALMQLRAQQKGLGLAFVTSPSLPQVIHTDPNRLRQILINIIGNAIKFTEFGEVTVRIEYDSSIENSHKIVFSIYDTGTGILPDQAARLFGWFTQADASTTRKFGGTGLGLALSRRLARSLGGDIILKNSSEDGSCFVVTIATGSESIKKIEPSKEVESSTKISQMSFNHLQGLHVLLVDDAPDNRLLVDRLLSKKGILVETAQNGREAIEMAVARHYDLILMDVQMPVLGGIEATQELRKLGIKTPIIALTAHAMKEEREKTRAAGCNAHLTKPIDIPQLFATLESISEVSHIAES